MKSLHDFLLPMIPMTLAAGLIVVPMLALAQTSPVPARPVPASPPAASSAAATRPALVPLFTATAGTTVMLRPRLSQLIGATIYNEHEEKIGEVEDILLFPSVAAPPRMTAVAPAPMASPGAAAPTTTPPATPPVATPSAAAPAMPASGYPLAVVQVGGFLGMGGRLITVPLADLRWNAGAEHIVLPGGTKEILQGRPAFQYSELQPR